MEVYFAMILQIRLSSLLISQINRLVELRLVVFGKSFIMSFICMRSSLYLSQVKRKCSSVSATPLSQTRQTLSSGFLIRPL